VPVLQAEPLAISNSQFGTYLNSIGYILVFFVALLLKTQFILDPVYKPDLS